MVIDSSYYFELSMLELQQMPFPRYQGYQWVMPPYLDAPLVALFHSHIYLVIPVAHQTVELSYFVVVFACSAQKAEYRCFLNSAKVVAAKHYHQDLDRSDLDFGEEAEEVFPDHQDAGHI